jgi:SAM-dependent methyltransferase
LPLEALVQTSAVDHADWNYRGLLGWLQRRRFALLLSLMPEVRCRRLLEVGYGSGVLMPELARRCEELFGADPHPMAGEVADVLAAHGVQAHLESAAATQLPFEAATFDCVIAVSALEYVEDLQLAASELKRVLAPGGALLVVTPGDSSLLDLALRVTTGSDAAAEYGDRRQRLVPTLRQHFRLEVERRFPPFLGRLLPLYRGLRLRP